MGNSSAPASQSATGKVKGREPKPIFHGKGIGPRTQNEKPNSGVFAVGKGGKITGK